MTSQQQHSSCSLGHRLAGRAIIFIVACVFWVSFMTVEEEEDAKHKMFRLSGSFRSGGTRSTSTNYTTTTNNDTNKLFPAALAAASPTSPTTPTVPLVAANNTPAAATLPVESTPLRTEAETTAAVSSTPATPNPTAFPTPNPTTPSPTPKPTVATTPAPTTPSPTAPPKEALLNTNEFNAKLTTEDYLSLPEHTRPSEQWLQQCVTELEKDKDIYKPFVNVFPARGPNFHNPKLSVQGNLYRLGDCIGGCSTCNNTLLDEDGNFLPGHSAEETIAGMYGAITECTDNTKPREEQEHYRNNFDVLEEIFHQIEHQKRSGFEKPGRNDLVIHLRLGDVIEYAHQIEDKLMEETTPADTLYLLTKGGKSHHAGYKFVKTIYSVNDYITILDTLKASKKVDKINIIGGSHRLDKFQQSKVYAHCLQRGLAKAGYDVQMQIDGRHPDIDFYFMSNAKLFMQSSGGYSAMVGHMVEHLGGEIVGDNLNDKAAQMKKDIKDFNWKRRHSTSPTDNPNLATTTTEAPTTTPATPEPTVGTKTPGPHTQEFDVKLTIQDYLTLPEHSIPSNNWLEQCAEELVQDKDIYKPFIDPFQAMGLDRGPRVFVNGAQGNLYRLGDCIRGCSTCNNTLLGENGKFRKGHSAEDTIAGMYGAITHCSGPFENKQEQEDAIENYDVLEEIFHQIEQKKKPGFEKPGPNDFVIHLRLGDVIDNAHFDDSNGNSYPANTFYLLMNGGKSHHANYHNIKTIYSVKDYIDVIEKLKASKKVDKIHLIGGSHRFEFFKQSKVYAHCLQRGLALAGHDVEMQIDGRHPDIDFYFMSNAKLFMQSSGGYSAMIGHMVEHLGGEIVGDNINAKECQERKKKHQCKPTDSPRAATSTTEAPIASPTTPEPTVGSKTQPAPNTNDNTNDEFDAKLTIQDYLSQPKHSIPSESWLEQCAAELVKDKDIYRPFTDPFQAMGLDLGPKVYVNGAQGNYYRLGDCIRGCSTCNNTLLDTEGNFRPGHSAEDTIAGMYGAITHCSAAKSIQEREEALENYDVLEEVFHQMEHQKKPGFEKPGPNDFVIHLRLGDVIESAHIVEDDFKDYNNPHPASTTYLLLNGGKSHHPGFKNIKTIYSVKDYIDVIEKLKASDKVGKIHIIGGNHRYAFFKQSKVYAHCLHRGLAKAGYDVEMQIEGRHPDFDFYFMSNAKLFMQSSGGYSLMIGNMVQHLGGKVINDDLIEKEKQMQKDWQAYKRTHPHGGRH